MIWLIRGGEAYQKIRATHSTKRTGIIWTEIYRMDRRRKEYRQWRRELSGKFAQRVVALLLILRKLMKRYTKFNFC